MNAGYIETSGHTGAVQRQGTDVQIRDVQIEDAAAIEALLTSLGYPDTAEFIKDKLRQQLEHPDARLLVAEDNSQVLGFVSLHFIPQVALAGDFCRISYFCVSEAARSQGIGDALEGAVTDLAKARGCDRIEVHCHSRREQAHRFYARQGYVESPKYLAKFLR